MRRLDVDDRFRAATPLVAALAERVAASGLPATVQHDDLHDGQVFVGPDGTTRLLDWGDTCVTHPFLVLAVPLQGVIPWGVDGSPGSEDPGRHRDAYLGPWARHLGTTVDDLGPLAADATRLGWACRVVNGHLDDDVGHTVQRLQMLVDGRVAS